MRLFYIYGGHFTKTGGKSALRRFVNTEPVFQLGHLRFLAFLV